MLRVYPRGKAQPAGASAGRSSTSCSSSRPYCARSTSQACLAGPGGGARQARARARGDPRGRRAPQAVVHRPAARGRLRAQPARGRESGGDRVMRHESVCWVLPIPGFPSLPPSRVRLSLAKEDRRSFQERSRRRGLVFRTGLSSARCARGCTTADNSGDAAVRPGSPRGGRARRAPTTGLARPTSSRAQLSPIHPPDGPAFSELQERPLKDTFKEGRLGRRRRPPPVGGRHPPRCLLRYGHTNEVGVVGPLRFEPSTNGFKVRCS